MFEVFSFSFNAVSPIILLAAADYIIKQTGLFDDDFFKKKFAIVIILPEASADVSYKIESIEYK